MNLSTPTELNLDPVSGVWFGFLFKDPFLSKMPNKKLGKEKLLFEKVAVTEKLKEAVAAGKVSNVPSYIISIIM